jgi:xanthine dehydrogenase accessory factor
MSEVDTACAVAHGAAVTEGDTRTLVAVFASPVASHLLHYGAHAGFRTVLVEPDTARANASDLAEITVEPAMPHWLDTTADVVVTDHHRDELGPMLRDALALPLRWVGVMGNPRHPGPHIEALSALGSPAPTSTGYIGPSASTSVRGRPRRSPSRRWPA